jgi:hypothetical protein
MCSREVVRYELNSWILFRKKWPPLWSGGHSSWLQIQRSGIDSRLYQIFGEVVGLERGPLSLVSTIEELLERKRIDSGLNKLLFYPQELALTLPTSGGLLFIFIYLFIKREKVTPTKTVRRWKKYFKSQISKIYFNIILPHTYNSSYWNLCFRFPHPKSYTHSSATPRVNKFISWTKGIRMHWEYRICAPNWNTALCSCC